MSKETFQKIYDWKAARARRHVDWSEKYPDTLKNVRELSNGERVRALDKLPGVGIPVASTILHFMYPASFPIVDIRTVQVLLDEAHVLDKSGSLHFYRDTVAGYLQFRSRLIEIRKRNPDWSLRDIDRALFAYHKIGRTRKPRP